MQVKTPAGKEFWIDKGALKSLRGSDVLSTSIDNQIYQVNETNRKDGIYLDGPYMTTLSTINANQGGLKYNGQYVKASKQAKTVLSTYIQVTGTDGKTFWIDKGALRAVTLSKIVSSEKDRAHYRVNQDGRKDGIYSAPYMTSFESIKPNQGAKKYAGQQVTGIERDVTSKGSTYVKVMAQDGAIFWIDKAALVAL